MDWYATYVKPWLEPLTALGTLVALGALVATLIKNRSDEKDRKQQVIVEQCKRTLEWAYNALMPDPLAQVPAADRLIWLTAARHILAFQELKKLVNREPHTRIVEDFEEFWRHRFYLALSHIKLSTPGYWSWPEPILENIHRTSALVVVDFAGWPATRADPVDLREEQIAALEARNGFKGSAGRGLRAYIETLESRYGKGTPSPKKPV